ncbi:hypothetical protein ACHQM5_004915 [Ranunculus cassubicifolius]
MISSLSLSSPPNALQPQDPFSFLNSSPHFLNFRIPRKPLRLSTSVIEKKLQLSWLNPDIEDYNGWGVVENEDSEQRVTKKKGFLSYFVIGASVSTLFIVAASLLARKGYKFNLNTMPWNGLIRLEAPSEENSVLSMSNENIVDFERTSESLEENVSCYWRCDWEEEIRHNQKG